MQIVLAGFNVDAEVIQEATQRGLSPDQLTPETLAAAYARISRNPSPVDELRRQARQAVARARASNEQIVFGMGHSSVAEHAVFNFDLMGLSRLAIEAVEQFRLCSYTEKSQRYIKLEDDVLVPREISELGLEERYQELVALQQRTYQLLYERLREQAFAAHPDLAADRAQHRTLEGWAKEDARYVTPLATEGQLGLTANARNLEHLIRRLRGHPLQELRELATQLSELSRQVAPSLIRYLEPTQAGQPTDTLRQLAQEIMDPQATRTLPGSSGAVQLVGHTPRGDTLVVAALLHGASDAPWIACHDRAEALTDEEQAQVIRSVLEPLTVHDAPPRAFEVVSLRFDLVVSASCFAQLKRHRMATLLTQAYDPLLGVTVPEAVEQAGLIQEYQQVMEESGRLYDEIAERAPHAASYVLTQAHRRRVLLQVNARELYHFSRLRLDQHAQWDIRRVAERMLHAARQVLPHTLMLACGKDQFPRRWAEVFSSRPDPEA